jgi:hypothetical protein
MLGYLPPLLPPQRTPLEIFDVYEAESRWARRGAARVPWFVYRDDPFWTPPLLADRRRATDAGQRASPPEEIALFYAESRSLTAVNPITGSLAVWVSSAEGVGAFGLFEAINNNEIIQALFEKGERWLFEHAGTVNSVRGPISLQPLRLSGLLIDGFGERPGGLLPYNPPYYPDALEEAGYERGIQWVSYVFELGKVEQARGRAPRVSGKDAPSTALHSAQDAASLEPASHLVRWRVLADRYAGLNQDLIPGLPDCLEEYAAQGRVTSSDLSRQGRYLVNSLLARALVSVTPNDGRPAHACLAIPDPQEGLRWANGTLAPVGLAAFRLALARTRRLHVFPAVAEESREGLYDAYDLLFAEALARGYETAVIAPIEDRDERSAEILTAFGARVSHRYTLHNKDL